MLTLTTRVLLIALPQQLTLFQTRRVTRAAVSTHNENATSRPITRSKPPSKGPPMATVAIHGSGPKERQVRTRSKGRKG